MLIKMTASNDLAALLPILAFVEELARCLGLGKEDQLSVRLAVEEAVTNVIDHAFDPGEDGTFDVACQTDSSKLTISIREKGIPFQPAQFSGSVAGVPETRGVGLRLMQGSMDQIIFRNLGRNGKEVCMIKHLPPCADPIAGGIAGRSESAAGVGINEDAFEIRPFRPEDASAVSRVAYKTYRYTYDDEFIYYPDQIVELNRQGKIRSVVAVSGAGEVVGHTAIKFHWPGVPVAEGGVLMVLPEFRHTRLAFRMNEFAAIQAVEMGLEAAFIQAVTSHTISQKAAAVFGFKDCAILLGSFYSGIAYNGIDAETDQKESAVVSYLQLKPRAPRDIYPPLRHRDMIGSIYDHLGLPANLPESPTVVPEGESILNCSRDTITNTAVIVVESYGAGVDAQVAEILTNLRLDRVEVVYLRLDLEHPHTAYLADEFERLGFFFAGILPSGLAGRDCLILQYLNNLRLESSRVRVHSPLGKELLQYVKNVGIGLI